MAARSTASRVLGFLWEFSFESSGGHGYVSCECCVLRRTEHPPRGVLGPLGLSSHGGGGTHFNALQIKIARTAILEKLIVCQLVRNVSISHGILVLHNPI